MYIVLVSSTGRKGPLAQGIEAQILGLYMAHSLGLVSLIVCVRVCVYGICVLVRTGFVCLCKDFVCVRGVYIRVHYGDYQTMFFVFISPARIPRGHSDFE